MSHIKLIDKRKFRTSLLSKNIAQFFRHEKVSALLLSAVLTGHFSVHLRPKVASQVTIVLAQFNLKIVLIIVSIKNYSFSFYFVLRNEISFFISF